jgi:hypothetical protein
MSGITDRARELLDYIFKVLGVPINSRPLSYESLLNNCTAALQRERDEAKQDSVRAMNVAIDAFGRAAKDFLATLAPNA